MAHLADRLLGTLSSLSAGPPEEERGDVPGWVLITIMTAGIVAVLWPLAGDTLTTMLKSALASVTPGG